MSKSLSMLLPDKNDALTRIKKFMANHESGVVLTAKEEKILDRMMFANGLLSERKFTREQVAEKIKEAFTVSIYTARADINNTYSLFASVTEDYKRYTLIHHIEYIEQKILKWETDKSLAPLVPKLLAEKTRAIAALSVEMQAPDVPPPIINLHTTVNITTTLPLLDALADADKLIEFEKNHDYAEFEIIDDEPTD